MVVIYSLFSSCQSCWVAWSRSIWCTLSSHSHRMGRNTPHPPEPQCKDWAMLVQAHLPYCFFLCSERWTQMILQRVPCRGRVVAGGWVEWHGLCRVNMIHTSTHLQSYSQHDQDQCLQLQTTVYPVITKTVVRTTLSYNALVRNLFTTGELQYPLRVDTSWGEKLILKLWNLQKVMWWAWKWHHGMLSHRLHGSPSHNDGSGLTHNGGEVKGGV